MRRWLLAMLLLGGLLAPVVVPATAQAPAVSFSQASQPNPPAAPQAPRPPASQTASPAPPPTPPAPPARTSDPDPNSRDLERAIEEVVEQALAEAGVGRRGRDMSPEMERAIANAIESAEGREVMSAVADKIRSSEMPGRTTMLIGLLVPIAFFAMCGLLGAFFYWRSQAKTRARLEFQTQLLSKFGTGQELAAFLGSGGSQRLMEELSAEPLSAKQRILKRTRGGAVLTAFGLVFLMAAPWLDGGFHVIAVFCLALGIALLASAAATYRLSEKMGLLRNEAPSGTGAGLPPDQGATS